MENEGVWFRMEGCVDGGRLQSGGYRVPAVSDDRGVGLQVYRKQFVPAPCLSSWRRCRFLFWRHRLVKAQTMTYANVLVADVRPGDVGMPATIAMGQAVSHELGVREGRSVDRWRQDRIFHVLTGWFFAWAAKIEKSVFFLWALFLCASSFPAFP